MDCQAQDIMENDACEGKIFRPSCFISVIAKHVFDAMWKDPPTEETISH